jgi:hypothetical protein
MQTRKVGPPLVIYPIHQPIRVPFIRRPEHVLRYINAYPKKTLACWNLEIMINDAPVCLSTSTPRKSQMTVYSQQLRRSGGSLSSFGRKPEVCVPLWAHPLPFVDKILCLMNCVYVLHDTAYSQRTLILFFFVSQQRQVACREGRQGWTPKTYRDHAQKGLLSVST